MSTTTHETRKTPNALRRRAQPREGADRFHASKLVKEKLSREKNKDKPPRKPKPPKEGRIQ